MASRALREYHQKRNFTRTKEPRGKLARRTGDLFVVQKHAARRLHYDFRLELDGVLKSWAVTRGPSLSPTDKRLAVRTEDHPLDYADFEGRIPEGEYGAGSVIVWDRGRWSTEGDPHTQLQKGHLVVDLDGGKLKGRWHLVHMKGRDTKGRENWLLIKAEDEYARADGGADLLEDEPQSIKTGRTVEEVAGSKVTIQPKHRVKRAGSPQVARLKANEANKTSKPPPADERKPIKGARAGALPSFVEPQLASATAKPPSSGSWVHEVKFDGYRLLARIDRGKAKLKTRSGLDWSDKFPSLKKALEALPVVTAFLDGEVVVETETGTPSFSNLQADLSEGRSDRFRYYLFDLLHLDGQDLTRLPLLQRKAALADLLNGADGGVLSYSEHLTGDGQVILDHACRLGLEGIVCKLATAPYRSGRSKSWLKAKCVAAHEFVIIGYVPSTTQRRTIGSLALGHYVDNELVYAGRVGSGFTAKTGEDLWRRLEGTQVKAVPLASPPPFEAQRGVRWVKPQLVAEVEVRGWTADAIARHAVFKGLRQDKEAADAVRDDAGVRRKSAKAKGKAAVTLPVRLTHPDRVLWPDAGVTKLGLAEFYAELWPWMSPHIVNRPLALVRCPGGVEEKCFFQKHAWAGIGDTVIRTKDPDGGEELLAIKDLEGLLSLVQASVLEVHVWGATLDEIEKPDGMTFDLDPDAAVEWTDVVSAAFEVRDRLKKLGLASFLKTTGGKGLHVYAPLKPHADWDAVKTFAHDLANAMARDNPRKYLAMASKGARRGRIFIDYLRNGRGATAVAAYSTRARPGATVSTPLAWDELGPDVRSDRFTVGNLLHRLSHADDPWKDLRRRAVRLPD
jgi:bifunctional non-homologous end joining protein LigD